MNPPLSIFVQQNKESRDLGILGDILLRMRNFRLSSVTLTVTLIEYRSNADGTMV